MDPYTGKIYDLEDQNIPDEVRKRLVPVSSNRADRRAASKNARKARRHNRRE